MESTAQRIRVAERHITRLERRIVRYESISRRYSFIRLGIAVTGGVAAYLGFQFGPEWLGWSLLGLFTLTFMIVAHYHSVLERGIRRNRVWVRIKRAHIARMRLNWEGIPMPPETLLKDDHPFARDLNIIGRRGLHNLVDTSLSQTGSMRLLSWLLAQEPNPETVQKRQRLVREMIPLALFRDKLTLNGTRVGGAPGERWEGEKLMAWLKKEEGDGSLKRYLLILTGIAAITATLFLLNMVGMLLPIWPLSLFLYIVVYLFRRDSFKDLFEDAIHLDAKLNQLRDVFLYLERYPFRSAPGVSALCEPFRNPERKPSLYLKRVARIANAASMQKNPLMSLLLNVAVPWDLYFAWRLQRERKAIREELPIWLDRWHELEALCSLANFADLNPEYTFPELRATSDENGPVFSAQTLGHPLLPEASRVCNDYSVSAIGHISLITGSNMSGKSTFLRTLGINLVLTFAGGPVCASSFRTMPFRLFTCMNVSDSVNDGISYFYAEVRRLKALLEELREDNPFPLFFLIDEIFRGTNNRERLIGSRSYVRALAGGKGTGAIATHDLELVALEEEARGITNYHFRETIEEGRMEFDYMLRTGPCPTTNALEIMRIEGLPVDTQGEHSAAE